MKYGDIKVRQPSINPFLGSKFPNETDTAICKELVALGFVCYHGETKMYISLKKTTFTFFTKDTHLIYCEGGVPYKEAQCIDLTDPTSIEQFIRILNESDTPDTRIRAKRTRLWSALVERNAGNA